MGELWDEAMEREPDPEELNKLLLRIMRGVNAQAFRALGSRVLSGPFSGMIVPEHTPWEDGNASTKLLGSYEHELHAVVRHAVWRRPRCVVNIGCAEGYYAIGLARLLPATRSYALDLDPGSLDLCCEMAEKNGVMDRMVLVRGSDVPASEAMEAPRLYVVDCEGAELQLMDPQASPILQTSDIIVECHDFLDPNISHVLADRFGPTHRVDLVIPSVPDLGHFPFLRESPTVMALLTIVEKRPMPTCWLACWANKRG